MKSEDEIINQLKVTISAMHDELAHNNINMTRVNMFAGEIYSLLWVLDSMVKTDEN